jgi:hypothetical protein
MPMNARLLRPISTTHPEAQVWRNAVIANGGTVSGPTLNAVSKFCRRIDAAGIRDKLYRLNLFAGTGLSAALVPLFRGASRTGTQYGNTTDTNNGPFVSGDYSETSGLSKGSGQNKYLDTGLATNALPAGVISSGHLAVWHGPITVNFISDPYFIGALNGATDRVWLQTSFRSSPTNASENGVFGKTTTVTAATGVTGLSRASTFLLLQRTSSTNLELWRNQAVDNTTATSATGIAGISHNLIVFRRNNSGTIDGDLNLSGPLRGYSVGDDMTSAQVGDFRTAWEEFNTALGRTA